MKPSATVIPLDPSATAPVPSRDVLQIADLVHTYANGVRALDGVTLSMPRGMYGLLGPNGAGKSTLMRIIATLAAADVGARSRFDGIDVLAEPMRLRAMLGYLPQDFGVYPRVSAETLLDHIAVLKGIGPAKARREEVVGPAPPDQPLRRAQARGRAASPAACASASASPRRCSAIRS